MKGWGFYSILALLIWGVWGFLPKLSVSCLDPRSAFIYQVFGGVLTGFFAFLILRPELGGAEIRGVVPAVLTGAAGYIGSICFLYALKEGKLCVIGPLTALYPVISLALAMIFLREKINFVQFTGVILSIISVILISHE